MSFAERVISFYQRLQYKGDPLPEGIRIMNPFRESRQAMQIAKAFYQKFYDDDLPRKAILGINPGRFGGGVTGILFTDTKRLVTECGIAYEGKITHEPSSVFVYEMINAFGGAEKFYRKFYINSICPLGFTSVDDKGKEKNYNYYDDKKLEQAVKPFIVSQMRKQIALGIDTDVCFCLGTGKNEQFFRKLNEEYGFFGKIIPLEHPRFVMQYKAASKQIYIDKYLDSFGKKLK